MVGFVVGFMASNLSKASFTAARDSADTSPESPLKLSSTEVISASLSVGMYGSLSIVSMPSLSDEVSEGSLMKTCVVLVVDLGKAMRLKPWTLAANATIEAMTIRILLRCFKDIVDNSAVDPIGIAAVPRQYEFGLYR